MSKAFKHTGLQVVEADISEFYEKILGFELLRSFSLTAQESNEIFGIDQDVTILMGTIGGVDLELFVSSKAKNLTFNHTCILADDATGIAERAQQHGYRVHTRGVTYFVSDNNNNIFEIKEKS